MISNSTIKLIKIAVLVVTITFAVIFAYMAYDLQQFRKTNTEGVVELKQGEGLSKLARKLKKANIIYNKKLFKVYALLLGYGKFLQSGEYVLSSKMSEKQILSKISKGKIFYRRITIPEGLTTKEVLTIVNDSQYLVGKVTINPKEGGLLPETYYFPKGQSRDEILKQMQSAMQKGVDLYWENRNINRLNCCIKSKEDMVNLASIVEKEALLQDEKPIIAAVYLNRLKKGMRLQADPTVIYGAKNYKGDITRKMLREKTDYNTYRINGLPKTAIANPDLLSLKAVANPSDVDYLYFVADGKGGHIFSKTYNEHRQNVKNYLKLNK
ncbi:MAG: endolytic transglycosylase MltG [Proteobacteria bacterium]|nr:endolytic transglycosylase MltG [Pseudomonadota bacterium]